MEALGILKFWRNAPVGADVSSECGDARNITDDVDDDTESEDSFFDLVLDDDDDVVSKKHSLPFIESPRDVFLSRNDVTISKPSSPATLLRSTTKFKVFTLGFRKASSKSEPENKSRPSDHHLSRNSKLEQSNRMDESPVVFARDNSLRSKLLKENAENDAVRAGKPVRNYLKLIKPLYVKKAKVGETATTPSSSPLANLSPRKISESGRVGSFKIVGRNLGKSRSASTIVGVAAAAPVFRRRDDTLLEDGIQGAILHCKKSYNSSSREFSQLFRSASDPSHELKLRPPCRNSHEEQKRCSI